MGALGIGNKGIKLTSDLLVAHRGYQAKYPEDQLSLTKVIQAGASFIERYQFG